jgi:hypothetical protein
MDMGRARSAFLFSLVISLAACKTPAPPPSPAPTGKPMNSPGNDASQGPARLSPPPIFDPKSITPEEKKETLISVADLILELNRITREKNFEAWRSYLTPAFQEKYSDPVYLAEISGAYLILRVKKIVLKTLRDYFDNVVYPSHQNDRVDDIEYIGHNRVKAVYYNDKSERRVLWDLERVDGTWKIGVGSGLGI